jgi:hypothetical protein
MCSHYESVKDRTTLKSHFGIDAIPDGAMEDLWPGYEGVHEVQESGLSRRLNRPYFLKNSTVWLGDYID